MLTTPFPTPGVFKSVWTILLLFGFVSDSQAQGKDPGFWKKPMTSVQFNLQIKDAAKIQPEELMRIAKEELHADAVMFNAGGGYAWYPTKVPFHHQNPFMAGRDILGEAVAAAKKYDLKILARVDFSRTVEELYHQNPDWYAVTPRGAPQTMGEPRFGDWSLLYKTCPAGPYRNETVAVPVLKEIIRQYDVDAFFFSFAKWIPSWSSHARQQYFDLYGKQLPEHSSAFETDYPDRAFQQNWDRFYEAIKSTDPKVTVVGRLKMNQRADLQHMTSKCDVISAQPRDDFHEGWTAQDPHWWSAAETNFAQAIHQAGERPLVLTNTGPGLAWRHITLPKAEFQYWMASIVANGGNVLHSMTGIPATMEDQRTLANVAEFNLAYRKVQPYLADNRKVVSTAIVISRMNHKHQQKAYSGFIEALSNHQIPFDLIPEHFLSPEHLKKYKVLILPRVEKISDVSVAAVRSFVKNGGALISSYTTATQDEQGIPRTNNAFSEELGVDYGFQQLNNQYTSYIRIDKKTALTENLGDTKMIAGAENLALVRSHPESKVLMTHIPPFAVPGAEGNPPERINLPVPKTNTPVVVQRGRNTYFANQIGELVWKYRLPDHQKLIANAVKIALAANLPVEVPNYRSVYPTLFQQGNRLVLHLVNGTGVRPLLSTTTLRDVKLQLQVDRRVKRIKTVFSEEELTFQQTDQQINLSLPELPTWEVLIIE